MELTAADKTIRNRKEEGEENSPRKTDPASTRLLAAISLSPSSSGSTNKTEIFHFFNNIQQRKKALQQ